jgi:uncharacterized protein YjbI with pentapeptide repeats
MGEKAWLLATVVIALLAIVIAAMVTRDPGETGFIVTAAVAVAISVLATFWLLPKVQAAKWPDSLEPKDRIELEDKSRGTIGQLVSAVGLVATVAITLVSVTATQESSRQTLELTRRGQSNERFARAIDQLGARDSNNQKTIEIRLGGIYLLQQFATDSDATFARVRTVATVLSAYVRSNSPRKAAFVAGALPKKAPCVPGRRPVEPDVQAALDVLREIFRKGIYTDPPALDLSGADLSGASLASLDLRNANLTNARLFMTHLDGAQLDGANLGGVDARSACVVLASARGARFTGSGQADEPEIRRQAADLRGAALQGTDFTSAQMSYVDMRDADLEGTIFTNASVGDAKLAGTDPSKVRAGRDALPCGGPNPPCP